MFFNCIGIRLHRLWQHVYFVTAGAAAAAAAAVEIRESTSTPTVPAGRMPWLDCWLVQGLYWLIASTTTGLGGDKIYKESQCLICFCVRATICQLNTF